MPRFNTLFHRMAGVVLIAAGLWHAGYLGLTPKGRRLFLDLLPRWRDLTDPWRVLRYNLGFALEKPKASRTKAPRRTPARRMWRSSLTACFGVPPPT